MIHCKNDCKKYEQGTKATIYQENGSFCRICDYYFKEWYLKCPCCNGRMRHTTRNSKSQNQLSRVR